MDKNTPFFSVIIPTRNRAELLKRCVQSVLEQKFEDWELIIVDDGSEDNTREVVHDFYDDRIKYIYQEHQERSSARNRGIEKANGRYVCFIDDDDLISKDYLLDFYNYYESKDFPEVILRTGFVKSINGKRISTANYDVKKHKNPVNYIALNMCGVGSLCIPHVAIKEDKFPIEFPHWQDTHLFLRLLMKYDMIQLNSYNYVYSIHAEMGSKKATLEYDPVERAELNVGAIKDLFKIEKDKLSKFLQKNTLNFLLAEKYIQYAVSTMKVNRKQAKSIFRKSITSGIYLKLYKSYILFIFQYIKDLL